MISVNVPTGAFEAVTLHNNAARRPTIDRKPVIAVVFDDSKLSAEKHSISHYWTGIVGCVTIHPAVGIFLEQAGRGCMTQVFEVGMSDDQVLQQVMGVVCLTDDQVYQSHSYKGSPSCVRCGKER